MKTPLKICLCMCLFGACTNISCSKLPDDPPRRLSPDPPPSPTLSAPVANAGDDQVIYIPVQSARLSGSKSTDPNNDIKSYLWTQLGAKDVSMTNITSDGKEVEAFFPSDGKYQFELAVTDVSNLVSRDTVQITLVDNFAPGVAPEFVDGCDTLFLGSSDNSIYIWSDAAVKQGVAVYWLNKGYSFKQISGPTNANILQANSGSTAAYVSGLTKGTYVFGIEVERNGLKAYDTTVVRVIDDTSSGKEYYFETSWALSPFGDLGVSTSTPSRPEIFLPKNGEMKEFKLWLKLHNASDWIEIPILNWMDTEDYYFYTDRCSRAIEVSYWGQNYRDYIGKKVLMKIAVP